MQTQTLLSKLLQVEGDAMRLMREGLIPPTTNMERFTSELFELYEEQERRQALARPPIPIPCYLIAGARAQGIQVDADTGRVTGLQAPDGLGV